MYLQVHQESFSRDPLKTRENMDTHTHKKQLAKFKPQIHHNSAYFGEHEAPPWLPLQLAALNFRTQVAKPHVQWGIGRKMSVFCKHKRHNIQEFLFTNHGQNWVGKRSA